MKPVRPLWFVSCLLFYTVWIVVDILDHRWAWVAAWGLAFLFTSITFGKRIQEARDAYDSTILDTLKGLGGETTAGKVYWALNEKYSLNVVLVAILRLERKGLVSTCGSKTPAMIVVPK